MQELVALLKKDPSKRSFASSGSGTSTHLTGEIFGDVLPVTSFVVVAGLLDPSWRVEIEADAILPADL